MKRIFDDLSFEVSKKTTKAYSTSFSLGILALKPSIRSAIYAIYGYVRLADEIVDSFEGYDKKKLLQRLIVETSSAIEDGISINPILNSFCETVRRYRIPNDLINHFLHSMEMDLVKLEYNSDLYDEYIYGSAEVVGLMCLHVFTEGNKEKYDTLKPYAMKLGSAFQKVNFLRDMKDDYSILGRSYFPEVNFSDFSNEAKCKIEQEIEKEFSIALQGIKKLPASSMFGVYLAYKYYLTLFQRIKKCSSSQIMQSRIRIPNSHKAFVALKSYVRYKIAIL